MRLVAENLCEKVFILKTGTVLFSIMSLLFLQIAVSAQTATTGQISGSVTDQSGAVIPAADRNRNKRRNGSKTTVTTSDDGNYSIPNLAVGTYRLTVTKSGFKETAVSNVVGQCCKRNKTKCCFGDRRSFSSCGN